MRLGSSIQKQVGSRGAASVGGYRDTKSIIAQKLRITVKKNPEFKNQFRNIQLFIVFFLAKKIKNVLFLNDYI